MTRKFSEYVVYIKQAKTYSFVKWYFLILPTGSRSFFNLKLLLSYAVDGLYSHAYFVWTSWHWQAFHNVLQLFYWLLNTLNLYCVKWFGYKKKYCLNLFRIFFWLLIFTVMMADHLFACHTIMFKVFSVCSVSYRLVLACFSTWQMYFTLACLTLKRNLSTVPQMLFFCFKSLFILATISSSFSIFYSPRSFRWFLSLQTPMLAGRLPKGAFCNPILQGWSTKIAKHGLYSMLTLLQRPQVYRMGWGSYMMLLYFHLILFFSLTHLRVFLHRLHHDCTLSCTCVVHCLLLWVDDTTHQ